MVKSVNYLIEECSKTCTANGRMRYSIPSDTKCYANSEEAQNANGTRGRIQSVCKCFIAY